MSEKNIKEKIEEDLKKAKKNPEDEETIKGARNSLSISDLIGGMSGAPEEKVKRRREVIRKLKRRGMDAKVISQIFDISESSVYRIFQNIRDENRERVIDMGEESEAFAEIGDLIDEYDAMAREMIQSYFRLKKISEGPADLSDKKINYLKEARQWRDAKTKLLRKTGILPDKDTIMQVFMDNRNQEVNIEDVSEDTEEVMSDPNKAHQVMNLLDALSSDEDLAEQLEEEEDIIEAETTDE